MPPRPAQITQAELTPQGSCGDAGRGTGNVGLDRLQNLGYPPRAMRAQRAAAYLDLSVSTFLRFVDEGLLPPPTKVRGVVSWDRHDLDCAYEDWKAASGDDENTMHKLLRGQK
jgi:predicted DNA-binding transcriptional regulator AlpA